MQVAGNSSLVWKRESDENRRWARIFVRTSAALTIALLATGAYAISTHVQFRDLCVSLEGHSRLQPAPSVRKVTEPIIRDYCQA